MRIGFTGSREGMTEQEKQTLIQVFQDLGTWATIRYARVRNEMVVVLEPSSMGGWRRRRISVLHRTTRFARLARSNFG